MTDGWSVDEAIEFLTYSNSQLLNYKHELINHNQHFVDPKTKRSEPRKLRASRVISKTM